MSEATQPAHPASGAITPERIMQMAWGYAPPLMMETALRLGLFDLLDAAPLTAAEAAEKSGASERGVKMLLEGLVGLGLVSREGDRFSLAPDTAAFLVSSKQSYLGGFIRHTSGHLLPKWLQLTEVVRTGKPAIAVNQEGEGTGFFAEFVEDLLPMGFPAARALAEHLGVHGATAPVSVLDLAAGSGVWSIALALASPQVRVTAVDWPGVLPITQKITGRFGVADRYAYVGGDLDSADFGTGHQIATLGHILHSEGPERSKALLKKVFDALAPGGTIAIAEFSPNEERTGPPQALIFGVNMLVNTDVGEVFTFGQIAAWLEEAGFVQPRAMDLPMPSLFLATKPA